MGCTPSRGNSLQTEHGPFRKGRTLLPVTQESPAESQSDDIGNEGCCGSDIYNSTGQNNISSTLIGRKSLAEPENARGASAKLGTNEITVNILSQAKDKQELKQEALGKKCAKKSKKSVKLNKKRKERCSVEEKVDFPETLVEAHQAAYGYLNPNITKYEDLLGILDHATQTQFSLQPMVAFLVLRYEEINKGLLQIVEEGENMFKKHRDHLAWPCQKDYSLSSSSKKKWTSPTFSEPQPDLLQQLLQYTVQRMRLLGQSVCGIGDMALGEAVEYFNSISEILEEKLRTKHTFESRLMQLLSQIEAATQRKSGPDDSTLFSEDSGIGAESDSLTGSDRHCTCKERCDSTGTMCTNFSFTPVHHASNRERFLKTMSNSSSLNSIDPTCTITGKEQRDTESLLGYVSLDEGEKGVGENKTDDCTKERKNENKKILSNSSILDLRQPCRMPAKSIENPQTVEITLKLKDAIRSRNQFVPCQSTMVKTKHMNSPKSSSHQWTEDGAKSSKRPHTTATRTPKIKTMVTKQCRSRSADSLCSRNEDLTITELKRTQKEINQRLERIKNVKSEEKTKQDSSKQVKQQQTQGISSVAAGRQCSLNKNIFSLNNLRKAVKAKVEEQANVQEDIKEIKEKVNEKVDIKQKDKKAPKGPVKVTPVPSPPPSLHQCSGTYMGKNSVKKLINTFSQGLEESRQMTDAKVLGPLKGVRKCGVPIIPGLGYSGTLMLNDTLRSVSQCSEITEDLDNIDRLPPPPLEVLMDNSFENVQSKDTGENFASRGRSTQPKKTAMTQRLQASLQSITVLPSKGHFRKGSLSMSPVRTQDNRGIGKDGHLDSCHETHIESEEPFSLYKQTRKIIHLRHSSNSPTKIPTAKQCHRKLSSPSCEIEVTQEEKITNETVPNSADPTPSTPPVSRTRTLPSTPLLHRRLPSPPVFISKPTSTTLTSLHVVRKLPTPPSTGQLILPITSDMQHDQNPSVMSGLAYSFKAPSPPASPKVQKWSLENGSEDCTLRVFSNARSVFCPASSSLFEAQPVSRSPQAWASSGSSVLPRPWGERGWLPVSAQGRQPFIRRSQSDRRPSLTLKPKIPVFSVAETCGSEPAISTHGFEDGSNEENTQWNEQTELRGAVRSASHPDLCVVGQGLQWK
ncbi:photoreceptor cilium actin regulator [Misgurnus anguillicaudatus]|uniref:photoreceptor cilium actin regulator n=1 Tax=Misgurnus anguillicaudatus TaxID=75329 RepID=UPI003CCF8AE5